MSRAGGRPTPSSVLMLAVPARLAGVDEVIIATPPRRDGSISPEHARCGPHRWGRTGSSRPAAPRRSPRLPSAPSRFRPSTRSSAPATRGSPLRSGRSAAELPSTCRPAPRSASCSPTPTADAELVALDLLAQAEHGPDSVAVVVSDDPDLLDAVEAALPRLAAGLATGDRALETIGRHGRGRPRGRSRRRHRGGQRRGGRARQPAMRRRRCARGARFATRAPSSSARGRRSPPATTRPGRTTSCPPAARPAPGAASASSRSVAGSSCSGSRPTALDASRTTVARDRRGRGPAGARRERSRARADRAGSGRGSDDVDRAPPPAGRRSPPYPAEPSDEELAARAGIEVSAVVRADMNTLGGGPLPAVARGARRLRRPSRDASTATSPTMRLRDALGAPAGRRPETDRARRRAPTS